VHDSIEQEFDSRSGTGMLIWMGADPFGAVLRGHYRCRALRCGNGEGAKQHRITSFRPCKIDFRQGHLNSNLIGFGSQFESSV
jgi:hypothetical protein